MTDLETRVRDELAARAEDAGSWRVGGGRLRRVAQQRRSVRRRVYGTAAAVVTAVGLAGALLPGGQGAPAPDGLPVEPPLTVLPDDLRPEPSWTSVPLSDEMLRRAVTAARGSRYMEVLVSIRVPGSEQVLVVLGDEHPEGSVRVVTVTFDSAEPDAPVRRGTGASYPSYRSLVAQPAFDGDGAVLVVLVPLIVGDVVEVSSSEPGRPVVRTSAFLRDRLAIVPITSPESVTRLRILKRGEPRLDTIPAGALLGDEVPRTLERVVASTAGQRPQQPVQVRTDGHAACRVTAGGWWPQGHAFADWNPVDAACAEVDGALRLLLAGDRRYSSVAGIAPPAARVVRLHWSGGEASEVATAGGDVNAFVGPVSRPAGSLVRAEAVDRAGEVVATLEPVPGP